MQLINHHCDSSFDLWILIIPRGIFKLFLQNKVTGCIGSELSKAEFLCSIQWRWKTNKKKCICKNQQWKCKCIWHEV